ncbi:MAG: alpha/beta fold hydrolase [Pseudonocardiaceae bacterium]
MSVPTAHINGISVGYDDESDGAPLVLIHGHPFDRSMWGPQVGEFTRSGWRVIVPDLRGYGQSSVTAGPFAWATFAPGLHRRPRAAAHACAGRRRPGRRVHPSRRR